MINANYCEISNFIVQALSKEDISLQKKTWNKGQLYKISTFVQKLVVLSLLLRIFLFSVNIKMKCSVPFYMRFCN
jgi:hypothetical protein